MLYLKLQRTDLIKNLPLSHLTQGRIIKCSLITPMDLDDKERWELGSTHFMHYHFNYKIPPGLYYLIEVQLVNKSVFKFLSSLSPNEEPCPDFFLYSECMITFVGFCDRIIW